MSNDSASRETLEEISRIVAVLTAAENFDDNDFENFLYDTVEDLDDAVGLIKGVIGFISGMADGLGIDLSEIYAMYGLAAAEQITKKDN